MLEARYVIVDTPPPGTYSKVVTERGNYLAKCTGGRIHEQGGTLSDNLHCETSFAESSTQLVINQMRAVSLETGHR